jgi:type IX secretion system PorP/SprF family membrane protein
MIKKIVLTGCMLGGIAAAGQDIHFSQYNETPALLNPALTGMSSNYRLAAIYKDQWRSVTVPYVTFGAMFEMKVKMSAWEKVDKHMTEIYKKALRKLAIGVDVFNDRAGDGGMGSTRFDFSVSSLVPLNARSNLAVGLMGGAVQHSIDFTKLVWPDQYNGAGYSQQINSGENLVSSTYLNGDFAGGLAWTYSKDERGIRANNQLKADAGIAFYHINKPRQKFLGADIRMYRKMVVHGKMLVGIKYTNVSLVPSYLLEFQGKQKELLMGCMIRYKFDEDSKFTGYIHGNYFSIGAHYRNGDAVILSTLMEFGNMGIGLSYDVNVSKLHAVSTYRGGFEVMLRFVGITPFIYQNSSRF